MGDLQARLRAAPGAPMLGELRHLEERTNRDFRMRNAEVRADPWGKRYTMKEKAEEDPMRFLEETFPKHGNKERLVVVEIECSPHYLQQSAKQLGLFMSVMDMNKVTVVIGWSALAVGEKMGQIKKEVDYEGFLKRAAAANERYIRAEAEERERERKRRPAEEELARQKCQRVLDQVNESKDWNVIGSWKIRCPEIEEAWGNTETLTMEIYREETAKGPQMYAIFDFGPIEGFSRFERQVKSGKKSVAKGVRGQKEVRVAPHRGSD